MAALAARRHGLAWILLTAALAFHVFDEAAHDFLSVYNPAVARIRTFLPWLPIPTFDFKTWILGLTLAVIILFAMSPLAFRGHHWMVLASYPYAVLMTGNGLGHILGSIYQQALLPGLYSAPLLLAAAYYLWQTARPQSRGGAQSAAA